MRNHESAVYRKRDGTFAVGFHESIPVLLVNLGDQLDSILDDDHPDLRRLFPTAYPDDPDRDAGYQILARSSLTDQRRAAIETVRRTAMNEIVTEDELTDWMALVNDLRLVLGTRLDVSEDDEGHDLDPSDPEAQLTHIYHLLGAVLYDIVGALSETLPPGIDDDN